MNLGQIIEISNELSLRLYLKIQRITKVNAKNIWKVSKQIRQRYLLLSIIYSNLRCSKLFLSNCSKFSTPGFSLILALTLGNMPLALWLPHQNFVLSSFCSLLSLMDLDFSWHSRFSYSVQPQIGRSSPSCSISLCCGYLEGMSLGSIAGTALATLFLNRGRYLNK